jgi:GNAT superfamily N-acetyltransferase
VLIEARDPHDPELFAMITDQQRELAGLEGDGHISFPLFDGIEFLVGSEQGRAVACGALQKLAPSVGEIKRMYVRPGARGRGLSREILGALEALARERGMHTLRLETGRFLPAALGLYTSSGYTEIPLYGHYVGRDTSICFEKALPPVDNR